MPNELLLNFSVCASGRLKKEMCCGVDDMKSFDSDDILYCILFLEDERICRSSFVVCGCSCGWEVKDGL